MQRLVLGAAFTLASLTIPALATASPFLFSVQSNGNDHLFRIDAATGIATDLGLITFGDAEGLAFVGSTLYAIGGSEAAFWNITTPPGNLVGATGPRLGVDAGLDFNTTNGTMYNFQGAAGVGALYTINLATGAATLVGSGSTFADGLAIDAAGNAYAIDGVFAGMLYSVNLGTGVLTPIGSLGVFTADQFGLAFADGTLYALSSFGELFSVNTTTGALTFIADTVCGTAICDGFEGLAAQTTPSPGAVPEPATWLLLGSGLAAIAGARRRRRTIE